jgi:hypothetical protein
MSKKDETFTAETMKKQSLERFIVLVKDLINEASLKGNVSVKTQVYNSSLLEPLMSYFIQLGFDVNIAELKNNTLDSFAREFKGDGIVNLTISWD